MSKKKLVAGLGYNNLEAYVIANSSLKKGQFVFAMLGGDDYSHFLVAKDNQITDLGEFSYERFIRVEYGSEETDIVATTRFLDLCIKKLEKPTLKKVPMLAGNPDLWDKCYKKK